MHWCMYIDLQVHTHNITCIHASTIAYILIISLVQLTSAWKHLQSTLVVEAMQLWMMHAFIQQPCMQLYNTNEYASQQLPSAGSYVLRMHAGLQLVGLLLLQLYCTSTFYNPPSYSYTPTRVHKKELRDCERSEYQIQSVWFET